MARDKMIKIAIIIACCFLTSCAGSYNFRGTIKIATTKNVDLPGETGAHVRGEACRSRIFVVPTGYPTIEDALEDALEKGKGDLLRDAVIDLQEWGIPLVYEQECWIAEGTIFKVHQP